MILVYTFTFYTEYLPSIHLYSVSFLWSLDPQLLEQKMLNFIVSAVTSAKPLANFS